jgi:acetylornithine deacetylase/succinyl-diaminopimelate desuccinylase-like protein
MSVSPDLPLAAFDPADLDGTANFFGSQFEVVDTHIAAQVATWFADPVAPGDLLSRLAKAGLATQQWRGTLFAQSEAAKTAPALLVYYPSLADQRYNLTALVAAVEAWAGTDGLPPLALKLLVGPVTETLLKNRAKELGRGAIIYGLGEYSQGRPMISLGLKGLLEVELKVKTMSQSAPSAYSEIMPSAAWLLVRALDSIKSDAQEVKIDHFEDDLVALPGEESRLLLKSVPEHSDRLAQNLKQYELEHYIFELSDALVLQTKYRVPTVNISAIECGSLKDAGRLKLPATARARLDFHLLPDQQPAKIFELLKNHLEERNFEGLEAVQLPNSYAPTRTPLNHPFIQQTLEACQNATGKPALVTPISPFSGPLAMLKSALGDAPAVCTGLDEDNISEADFAAHVRFLTRLLAAMPVG